MHTITYTTPADFYEGITILTQKGFGFNADFDQLTITLTGAY